MAYTIEQKNELLDAFLADNMQLALLSTPPEDEDTGEGYVEVVGGGYSRVVITSGDWNLAENGKKTNWVDMEFGTASEDWTPATHFMLLDEEGGYLMYGELDAPASVEDTQTAKFIEDRLEITI